MGTQDILNPERYWMEDFDDGLSPDYGWDELLPSNLASLKPAFGSPFSRIVNNDGPSTTFGWVNRSRQCMERLRRFAQQFEDSYFTIVDYDRDREFVGRFTGALHIVDAGNDRWNMQGWNFEVVPGAPMSNYPTDFDRWGLLRWPVDDRGNMAVAVYSAAGTWYVPSEPPAQYEAPVKTRQVAIDAPASGDAVTFEYVGYGFRIRLGVGGHFGIVNVLVDGALVQTIDCYLDHDGEFNIMLTKTDLPWDVHRVQVIANGLANPLALSNKLQLHSYEVIR